MARKKRERPAKKKTAAKRRAKKKGGTRPTKKDAIAGEKKKPAAQKAASRRGRRPDDERLGGLDKWEVRSLVCRYFCLGETIEGIRKQMQNRHGVLLGRQAPYRILRQAAHDGEINFRPPPQLDRRKEIMNEYAPWIEDAKVVHSASVDDVANGSAELLYNLVLTRAQAPNARPNGEVHIGFSGGPTMCKTARAFAKELDSQMDWLPKKITLWALTAAFEQHQPTNNPSGFFTYFLNDPLMRAEIAFNCLPEMPSAAHCREAGLDSVRDAREGAPQLDFIVMSGSEYDDPHSMFLQYLKDTQENLALLEEKKIIGDLMLLPFSENGPIANGSLLTRALTLFQLHEFPRLIAKGTKVILVLGPCGECNRTKHKLLDAVFKQKEHYITHLVVDTKTVFELNKLRSRRNGTAGRAPA